MTLEDFEKSLAEDRERREPENHKDKDRSRSHRHHHHHRHHHRESSRTRESHDRRSDDRDEERRHRHKRSRRDDNGDDESSHKRRHRHDRNRDDDDLGPDEVLESAAKVSAHDLKRDSWMQPPSADDIDYIHRPDKSAQKQPEAKSLRIDLDLKIHANELNTHLRDLKEGKVSEKVDNQPAQHEVDYTFGDAGSQWRMIKLKNVYREAEEKCKKVEDVAIERYGDLRSFDDAREEEIELDRRETYGESYVGKEKPSGELFQERKLDHGIHRDPRASDPRDNPSPVREQGRLMETVEPTKTTQHLDATALNRLRAKMMKAKLKGSPEAASLEGEYNAAAGLMANRKEGDVVVLGVMENRMLAGGARSEVKPVENRRGRERGQVQENEDMSIEDMIVEERRTRGQAGGEGLRLAERIAKDVKFDVSEVNTLYSVLITNNIL